VQPVRLVVAGLLAGYRAETLQGGGHAHLIVGFFVQGANLAEPLCG
jgi:hypothetical protein